ncbi:MAG: bifunctional phosphopantothenoylcysteine decarboxylase/phosphopantothenate--cysteine ligase CoaBC [Candidatus Bathyarchaeota archaeon]
MQSHPSKDILQSKSDKLKGKRVVMCITGSVAAVRCPEIARNLMRHGGEVFSVMSPMAQKIIHPYLMEWATGNPVVTELTGKIEHVALAGEHVNKADLVLVTPATANTISKIAYGIDDTTVTSVASTAFGSCIPIIIVPAMHQSLYRNQILKENIKKLEGLGVEFVGPVIKEGKGKIADTKQIVDKVISRVSIKKDFSGLEILVTAGPTVEYIDPIRIITNKSSGKMGIAIAKEALNRGANVTIIYGPGKEAPPSKAVLKPVDTTEQMYDAVTSELKNRSYDMMIAAAAPADWTVKQQAAHKISTRKVKSLKLDLEPTKKIINYIKRESPELFLIAFRAEHRLSKKKLIESGYQRLLEAEADLIVTNDVGKKGRGFGTETNEVLIIDTQKKVTHIPLSSKTEIAREIFNVVRGKIKEKCP